MIDVGQSVGNYNITAKLGEGGMGTVFLAEHPVIGSKVALKAIHPQFARDGEIVNRFVNEAKAVNQIGHDHIVDITDFGTAPTGDFYFMMEYLEGEILSDAITKGGPFPPARALNIAAQIADALDASHGHGIIHRDLKPENIFLIVRDGVQDFVKVLDFGLAKLTAADDQEMHRSRAGSVMGSPYYMSPEQCEGRATIDHRTDVYALGVILFEMLTGKIPFGGEGYAEILMKHVTLQPPAARSVVPELPPSVDVILFRALAKIPDERFATMREFREAILDPQGYGSSVQLTDEPEDLTARVMAAKPMARTDINIRPGSGTGPHYVESAGKAPSTFRDSVGEVWVREDGPKPARHRLRGVVLGVAALACLAAVGTKYRQQATRYLHAAAAPSEPATVRITFNSDPNGATVARSDGTVVGVTPLSADVRYGYAAIEYVIRLDGYLAKTASIVPNATFPFFVALVRDERAPLPEEAPTPEVDDPAIARSPPEPPATAAKPERRLEKRRHLNRVAAAPPTLDRDETLAPSEP